MKTNTDAAAFFATMDDELAAAGLHLLGELAVRRPLDDRDRLLVASVVTELGAVRDGLRVAEALARLRRFIAQLGLTIFDLPALSLGRSDLAAVVAPLLPMPTTAGMMN